MGSYGNQIFQNVLLSCIKKIIMKRSLFQKLIILIIKIKLGISRKFKPFIIQNGLTKVIKLIKISFFK